jgi:O-antigen/teichoic acid export membrane protein
MQAGGAFIYLIIGLVLLFPLSTDPLRRIPASRLSLWPLDRRERWLLRATSPWINPMTWAIAALAVWAARGKVTLGLWGLVAGLVASGFLLSSLDFVPAYGIWRRMPRFPGPLNQLIRKNLREILSTLDFYCALLLSLSILGFRIAMPALPHQALLMTTLLVVTALSSYAQSLFGMDGKGGLARYRLLPLPGWQILAAKDIAFLLVMTILTLPLAPIAGFGGALIALATGHYNSVSDPRPQVRWRFTSGADWKKGIPQVVAIMVAASAIFSWSVWLVIPCIAALGLSLWWCGRLVEQTFIGEEIAR